MRERTGFARLALSDLEEFAWYVGRICDSGKSNALRGLFHYSLRWADFLQLRRAQSLQPLETPHVLSAREARWELLYCHRVRWRYDGRRSFCSVLFSTAFAHWTCFLQKGEVGMLDRAAYWEEGRGGAQRRDAAEARRLPW